MRTSPDSSHYETSTLRASSGRAHRYKSHSERKWSCGNGTSRSATGGLESRSACNCLTFRLSLPEDTDEDKEQRGTSWASATRELRRLRHRIEAVGGSKDQWEAGVWHMDNGQWHLLWTGEQAFWHAVTRLIAAGHGTVEGLAEPRKSSTGQPYKIPRLMAAQDGECT
jgi:hypothetical protein